MMNDWYNILFEQLHKIKQTGLIYNSSVNISVVHNNNLDEIKKIRDLISHFENTKIVSITGESGCGECITLKQIKKECDSRNEEFNILYIHSKGVTQFSSEREIPVRLWRKLMEHYLIEKWMECVNALNEGYDCCGINYQNHVSNTSKGRYPTKIFNGNFFWASSKYIKMINNNYIFESRHCAENWLLSEPHVPFIINNEYADVDLYKILIKPPL